MIKVCKNCRYWCASALEHNMIGYCEGGNNKYMPEHIRVKHRTHEACSMFKPIQEAQDIIDEAYQQGRTEAIDEFVAFANTLPTVEDEDGYIRPMWLEEMAEKLKEQMNDK